MKTPNRASFTLDSFWSLTYHGKRRNAVRVVEVKDFADHFVVRTELADKTFRSFDSREILDAVKH